MIPQEQAAASLVCVRLAHAVWGGSREAHGRGTEPCCRRRWSSGVFAVLLGVRRPLHLPWFRRAGLCFRSSAPAVLRCWQGGSYACTGRLPLGRLRTNSARWGGVPAERLGPLFSWLWGARPTSALREGFGEEAGAHPPAASWGSSFSGTRAPCYGLRVCCLGHGSGSERKGQGGSFTRP